MFSGPRSLGYGASPLGSSLLLLTQIALRRERGQDTRCGDCCLGWSRVLVTECLLSESSFFPSPPTFHCLQWDRRSRLCTWWLRCAPHRAGGILPPPARASHSLNGWYRTLKIICLCVGKCLRALFSSSGRWTIIGLLSGVCEAPAYSSQGLCGVPYTVSSAPQQDFWEASRWTVVAVWWSRCT